MGKKMGSSEIMAMYDQYLAMTYKSLPVVLVGGRGVKVYNPEGREFLDFWAAYSALNLGHSHPAIVKTMIEKLKSGALLTRACYNDELALLGKELSEAAGLDMVVPKNGGAEAVETAVKAARMYAYRARGIPRNEAEIIVCRGNFHGRTTTVISFSAEPAYKADFGPLTPGFKFVPYNDCEALENAITDRTIAFLVEPIQGEGGILVPADDYLKKVREICTRKNILLILDEIQTGFGRTGKLFCFQHSNIKPDILIVGKSLGGGVLPVSAIVGTREILQHFKPGDDGSTFGGFSMAAAVARTSLRLMIERKIPEQAAKKGEFFTNLLRQIKSPYIKEVRGKGLMVGIELYPEAGGARRFCVALVRDGLICKESHHDVMRFSPPLIISKKHLEIGARKIEKALLTFTFPLN